MRSALLGLLWLAGSAFADDKPLRVLFIGNSHTYVHDVPGLVQALAGGMGRPMHVQRHAQPSWSLADHLKDRRLRSLLGQGWDWVVLQQGASAQPLSRDALVSNTREITRRLRRAEAARRRDAIGSPSQAGGPRSASVRRVGQASEALQGAARVALYSTWPPLPLADTSHEAEANYRQAAEAAHGCVLPVAAAWRTAIQGGSAPPLYSEDQLHASRAGAVLAALVIATALSGREQPPPLAVPAGASPEEAARLRSLEHAAAAALAAEPLKCSG